MASRSPGHICLLASTRNGIWHLYTTTYLSLNGLEVSWPHVLASIYSESLDTNVDQVVEIVSDLAAHIILTTVQIIQANQVAVTHLNNVFY
jgi:hypothetical protein